MNSPATLFDLGPQLSMEQLVVNRCYALLRGDSVPTRLPGLQLTGSQRALLREIVHHCGAHRAVSAAELARRCGTNDREVRSDVNDLRKNFGLRIGSNRSATDGGYYLITSQKELASTCAPFLNQARAEIDIVRSMCDEHELREIAGQQKFNLNDPLATTEDTDHAAA